MDAKLKKVAMWDGEFKDQVIDLSDRPVSPCSECLVAAMCKRMCPDITDYFFEHETYDRALERTLIQCATNYPMVMDMFELRSHRKGVYKRWVVRTYRGRIQSFEPRAASVYDDQ